MLAGPESTLDTMTGALADTLNALDAAAEIDLDRSAADRKFFAARKKTLAPLLGQLVSAKRAIEDYDLGAGSRLQARVEMGDQVLDRGVSEGNARTKLALKGKAGLDATHAFGKNVATLTKEKIAVEPTKVLEAVVRLGDLADFPEKKGIAKDLTKRAQQQQDCLDEREKGAMARTKLVSTGIKLVVESADALAALKGALDERFPRQRDYVTAFFADVGARKAAASAPPTTPAEPGPGDASPA
ncbi:MAG: hypothetical protein ABI193_09880 [Minicystis sp.]